MASVRRRRSALGAGCLLGLIALLQSGCTLPGDRAAVVSGKTVYREMAVEEVVLAVFPAASGASQPVTRGRSGYHGSFTLRLPPGEYRIAARGTLPGPGATTLLLEGARLLTVPPGQARLDQVRVDLAPR